MDDHGGDSKSARSTELMMECNDCSSEGSAPKDGYISESEDESQISLRQAPARVFRNGKLKIHKTYNGPVPLTYVDTGPNWGV